MDFDEWNVEYRKKYRFRNRLAHDNIVDKAITHHCRQTWEAAINIGADIKKITLIVKDELNVLLNIKGEELDKIISNLKIRLERDLTTPEGEKIIKKGL